MSCPVTHNTSSMNSRGVFVNLTSSDCSDWLEQIDSLNQIGQIGHFELLTEFLPTAAQVLSLQGALSPVQSFTMHAPYVGVALASHDKVLRQAGISRIKRACIAAESLGCSAVTVHSGVVGVWDKPAEAMGRLADSLRELAGATSVPVGLENMPRRGGGSRELIVSTSDIDVLLFEYPEAQLTLDVGHCLQNGQDPSEFVERYSDRIVAVHLHDGILNGPGHLTLEEGDLLLQNLLSSLHDSGCSAPIALETVGYESTALSWKRWTAALTSE